MPNLQIKLTNSDNRILSFKQKEFNRKTKTKAMLTL